MLAFEDHAAEGRSETDIKAVAIPRRTFDDLIDDIVLQRMDLRLAPRLLGLADLGNAVHATHAVLGTELGTVREVSSRTLSEFQRCG